MKRVCAGKDNLPMECIVAETNASGLSGVKKRFRFRLVTFAASVLLLILLFCVFSNAVGFNVWRYLFRWDDEYVYYQGTRYGKVNGRGREDYLKPSYNDAFTQKLEEMELYPLLPFRLPEGFTFQLVESGRPIEYIRWARGFYENNERLFSIMVDYNGSSSGGPTGRIFKDEREPIIYDRGGLRFYIVHNLSYLHAFWLDPPYTLDMGGNVSVEELKMVIDSMFERK